jgi:hypothetical protein
MKGIDLANAAFEVVGGLMVFDHCRALWRDKEVKGVSIPATCMFVSWGIWNLYYYPMLEQWASFAGGLVIVTGNTLWVWLMFYYTCIDPPVRRRPK